MGGGGDDKCWMVYEEVLLVYKVYVFFWGGFVKDVSYGLWEMFFYDVFLR